MVDQSVRALVEGREDLAALVFRAEEQVARWRTRSACTARACLRRTSRRRRIFAISRSLTVSNELERLADHGEQVPRSAAPD